MRLTRGISEATSAVTAASTSLSELAPDIRRTAQEATDALMMVTIVAVAALMLAATAIIMIETN